MVVAKVMPQFCGLQDYGIMVVSREPTRSPDNPVLCIYHGHQNNSIKIFKVMVLLCRFRSTYRAFDRYMAAINCSPRIRKLPKFFGVEHLLLEFAGIMRKVAVHTLFPHVLNYGLTKFTNNRAYCGLSITCQF